MTTLVAMMILAHPGHVTGDIWHDSISVAVLVFALAPIGRIALAVLKCWRVLRGARVRRPVADRAEVLK